MRLQLVRNSGKVLRHSSTLRLLELSILVMIIELVAAFAGYLPIEPMTAMAITTALNSLAWGARLIAQNALSGDKE